MTHSLTAPYHFIFYQAIFAPNSAPNFKNSPQIDFGAQFGQFLGIGGGFLPKTGSFTAIRGIKKCPKHDFQKILCGRKTYFSRMQILIFLPLPHILSPLSTLFSPPLPKLFPQKKVGKTLRKVPETSKESP